MDLGGGGSDEGTSYEEAQNHPPPAAIKTIVAREKRAKSYLDVNVATLKTSIHLVYY